MIQEMTAAHVHDITYGAVESNKDNLIVVDDSIVRGTTLKQSILKILTDYLLKKSLYISALQLDVQIVMVLTWLEILLLLKRLSLLKTQKSMS